MPSDLDPVLERRPTDLNRREPTLTEREAEVHYAPGAPAQALLTVADVLAVANSHADAVSAIADARKVVAEREADATAIQGRLDAIGMVIGSERLQAILGQAASAQAGEAVTELQDTHDGRDTVESASEEAHGFGGAQGEETRASLWSGRRASFAFGKPRP